MVNVRVFSLKKGSSLDMGFKKRIVAQIKRVA